MTTVQQRWQQSFVDRVPAVAGGQLALQGEQKDKVVRIMQTMYEMFTGLDASLIEIRSSLIEIRSSLIQIRSSLI